MTSQAKLPSADAGELPEITFADLVGDPDVLVAETTGPERPRIRAEYRLRSPELTTQADRILKKLGGPAKLFRAFQIMGIDVNRSTIYRWTYPREKGGTGGLIPSRSWRHVLNAARLEGIILTAEDKDPAVLRTYDPYVRPHMVEE